MAPFRGGESRKWLRAAALQDAIARLRPATNSARLWSAGDLSRFRSGPFGLRPQPEPPPANHANHAKQVKQENRRVFELPALAALSRHLAYFAGSTLNRRGRGAPYRAVVPSAFLRRPQSPYAPRGTRHFFPRHASLATRPVSAFSFPSFSFLPPALSSRLGFGGRHNPTLKH